MARLRVGLTGGLASGKSTVARRLAEAGCTVVDADEIVRELHRPGGAGAQAVLDLFGPGYLDATGATAAPRVAERVFTDPQALAELEARLHPLVARRFAEIAAATDGIAVLEATKLLEAGFAADLDLVVTVEAEPESRIQRAMARGLSEAQARQRLASQSSPEARRAIAQFVIENSSSIEELETQVGALVELLERRIAAASRNDQRRKGSTT